MGSKQEGIYRSVHFNEHRILSDSFLTPVGSIAAYEKAINKFCLNLSSFTLHFIHHPPGMIGLHYQAARIEVAPFSTKRFPERSTRAKLIGAQARAPERFSAYLQKVVLEYILYLHRQMIIHFLLLPVPKMQFFFSFFGIHLFTVRYGGKESTGA